MKTTDHNRITHRDDTKGALDKDTFEQVFELMYSPLSRYAATYVPCRHACEDIVQGAFVSLWEHRASVRVLPAVRGWLFTTVRNGCLNYLKKEGRKSEYDEASLRASRAFQDDGDAALTGELYGRLDVVLARLPEAYRSVFERHALDRERMESIAERLGLSVRTAKRYKAAAMKAIKRNFGDLVGRKGNFEGGGGN